MLENYVCMTGVELIAREAQERGSIGGRVGNQHKVLCQVWGKGY